MITIKNDTYLRALKKQSVPYTPVWMMRQAGRYLPEYRKVRNEAGDFLRLCKTPELACEVTLQPLRRFALDAAILFSDILTIPDAMGLGLDFIEGEGPVFHHPITTVNDVKKLIVPEPDKHLCYVIDAVALIKKNLDSVPLIGFSGSPWTLACYMLEGGSSKLFKKIKQFIFNEPQTAHILLNKLADAVIDYLLAQITAGVDAVQIFDTWGGILSTPMYHCFSLQYMQKIVHAIKAQYPDIPVILFTKQGGAWLESIAETGCTAIGLDWTVDIGAAKQRVGQQVSLQGNLDPMLLFAKPEVIQREIEIILSAYGSTSGHIFNLGHGIDKDTPIEHVEVFINTVHELSSKRVRDSH